MHDTPPLHHLPEKGSLLLSEGVNEGCKEGPSSHDALLTLINQWGWGQRGLLGRTGGVWGLKQLRATLTLFPPF